MNAAGTRPIRLLLVDYQQAVRRGLKMRLALEPDLEVVGEAGAAEEAISLACALRPDVIVMDVEMPGPGSIAATGTLCAVCPQSTVVIFTLRDDVATRERALAAGAAEFIAKQQSEETLLAAIRQAAVTPGKHRRDDRASASREEHEDDTRERGDP